MVLQGINRNSDRWREGEKLIEKAKPGANNGVNPINWKVETLILLYAYRISWHARRYCSCAINTAALNVGEGTGKTIRAYAIRRRLNSLNSDESF